MQTMCWHAEASSPKTGNLIYSELYVVSRQAEAATYAADFRVTYFNGFAEVIHIIGGPVGRYFSLRQKLFELEIGMGLIVIRLKHKKWVRGNILKRRYRALMRPTLKDGLLN